MKRQVWLMVAFLSACHTSAPPRAGLTATLPAAEIKETARLATPSLPPLDIPRSAAPARLQLALDLAQSALGLRLPRLAGGTRQDQLDHWIQQSFRDWITRRSEAASRAETAIRGLDHAEFRERLVAPALVGLLNADFADQILAAPLPPNIRRDQELQDVYREALETHAEPYRQQARSAFESCVAVAAEAPTVLPAWADLCRQRLSSL